MKIRKKVLSYVITFILIFSFMGCSSSPKPAGPVSRAAEETKKSPVSSTTDETKKSSAAESFKTYSNSKFGYSLSYLDIYTKKSESDNGDGISMESSDKLHALKIWGSYNVLNSSGFDLMNMAKDRVSHIISDYADKNVYKIQYGGGDKIPIIFNEFGCIGGDKIFGFIISYPEKEKGKYTGIVKQMMDELTKNTTSSLKAEVKKPDSGEKAVPDKKAEFTYNIIDDIYKENGITIKFPQLTKASDPIKGDSINKAIQESIRGKLDSLRSGKEDMGALTLDLNYKTAGYSSKVFTVSYQGYSHFKQAAYPVNVYHTQNIALDDVHTIALKDIFTIDDFFVERFKSGMYSPSREDLDLEKSGVKIKEEIERLYSNKELITMFQKADANYKLTEYGVILSIEVPHVLGDHLEMAINYETIERNFIKKSPVWKDYLFIKTSN